MIVNPRVVSQIFRELDLNKDGMIDASDLMCVMKDDRVREYLELTEESIPQLLRQIGRGGTIRYNDFYNWVDRKFHSSIDGHIRHIFDFMDDDKDGLLKKENFTFIPGSQFSNFSGIHSVNFSQFRLAVKGAFLAV